MSGLRRVLTIVAIVTATVFCTSPAHADDQQQILSDIAATTGTDERNAIQIINAIVEFMRDLQSRVSYIASSADAPVEKDHVARDTIEQCFVSARSQVEITSVGSRNIRVQPVSVYLYRLARLRQYYGYTNVELFFRPNYLGMGRVYPIAGADKQYEVSVSVVQIFVAYKYETQVYSDATTKKFRVRFSLHDDEIHVTVDEVLVSETLANPNLRSER